ncbi:MAG: hypothetical protein D6736_08785 [Nitrospinota bacterium]|nr:MAG: hypothetical protein D6736_08785 [Nitrospinota bacterium]
MEDQLKRLVTLQKLDREMRELEALKARIAPFLQEARGEVIRCQEALQKQEQAVTNLKKERKRKESQIEVEELALQKAKGKLLAVKTNREYTAVLEEIDTIHRRIDSLEDEVLALMEAVEKEEEVVRTLTARLQQVEEEYRAVEREKEGEREELDRLLATKAQQRQALMEELDPTLVDQYTRIAHNRNGLAVVPLKDDICQGCFLSLPPQLSHELRKYERLITCSHCQRILYWPEEQEAQGEPTTGEEAESPRQSLH